MEVDNRSVDSLNGLRFRGLGFRVLGFRGFNYVIPVPWTRTCLHLQTYIDIRPMYIPNLGVSSLRLRCRVY